MRTIIGLVPKHHGSIEVLGVDLDRASDAERRAIERRWGVLFQQGALFSSLTALQNVQLQMREYLGLSERLLREVGPAKLEMVGLSAPDSEELPSELSGGMTKRAALGPCSRARSQNSFPGRADIGPRPNRGWRFRRTNQDAPAHARADCVRGDTWSGKPAHCLRSRCRVGKRQGDR
jgi:ABC transporter